MQATALTKGKERGVAVGWSDSWVFTGLWVAVSSGSDGKMGAR